MKAIVDLQSIGRDHIPFNTSFLQIMRRIAGSETILLICRADHEREIHDVRSDLNIGFIELPDHLHKPPPGRLVAYREADHHAFLVDLCKRHAIDHLVVLGVRADLLERIRRRPPTAWVDIVFHATLAEPVKWRSRNPLRSRLDLFGVLGRRFPSNVRLVFLEDGVARAAGQLITKDTRIAVFPHPILGEPAKNERAIDTAAINVGFLGENNPGRGFEHFLDLAQGKPSHLRLHCVGRRGRNYDPGCDVLFDTPPSPQKLSQAEFDRRARANDIIFLPLDAEWYNLVASGTLIDCIRFAVPPVVVRNAVVSAIEEKFGAFGFVVDSAVEGVDLIRRMSPQYYLDHLPRFRPVLYAIAADRTIDAVSRRFDAMLGPLLSDAA